MKCKWLLNIPIIALLVLAIIGVCINSPYTSYASTVTTEPQNDTYYNAFSDCDIIFPSTSISPSTAIVRTPRYFQNRLEGSIPSAINDRALTNTPVANDCILYNSVIHSYGACFVYLRTDLIGDPINILDNEVMVLNFENKLAPLGLIEDMSNLYVNSSFDMDINVHLECLDIQPYNEDDYTYSQPFTYENTLEVPRAKQVNLDLLDINALKTAFDVQDINDLSLYIKTLTIEFISTGIFYPSTYHFNFLFDNAHQLERGFYEVAYLEHFNTAFLSQQREDNALGLLFAPVSAFLRTEIAPNITFGLLVLSAVAIAVLAFLIKVMANS